MTQSTDEFIKTDSRILKATLERLHETTLEEGTNVQVCAGEWRPDPNNANYLIFWQDPDWIDPTEKL